MLTEVCLHAVLTRVLFAAASQPRTRLQEHDAMFAAMALRTVLQLLNIIVTNMVSIHKVMCNARMQEQATSMSSQTVQNDSQRETLGQDLQLL